VSQHTNEPPPSQTMQFGVDGCFPGSVCRGQIVHLNSCFGVQPAGRNASWYAIGQRIHATRGHFSVPGRLEFAQTWRGQTKPVAVETPCSSGRTRGNSFLHRLW
jgi:hypothetical protein